MKLVRPLNAKMSADKVGHISLRGYLKADVSAAALKDALDYFVGLGAERVEIFLENCLGGSIFEGSTMSAHIRACPIPVDAKTAGACASMATIIFGSCRKREIDGMGYLVTHRPSNEETGCYEALENTSKNLKKLFDDMGKIYAALTGMTEEEAKVKFMPFGKDVYFSATEAVQLKLATGTWNSGIQAALPLDVLMQSDLKAVAAFYDKQLQNNSSENSNMELTKVAMAIGMVGEIDENKILAAVAKLSQDNADLKSKVAKMELDVKTETEKNAKAYVKSALDAGKITAAEVAPFEKMAINDLDSVRIILDARKPHKTAGEQMFEHQKEGEMTYGRKSGESDGQFYMRLWKNDAKTLERIQKENPVLFKQLKDAGVKEA